MDKKELLAKIVEKKEYSNLPKKDVELAFSQFDKKQYLDEEKIKLTRNFLRRIYVSFSSVKLLNLKDKNAEWVLKKHRSTKERFEYYPEIYKRILLKEKTIIDLGAGVNGFSYSYFKNKIKYVATEAVGQLVDLMNFYFKRYKINAKAHHLSLFELEKTKELIKNISGSKVIFLFKVIDSLEMLEKNYSKKLLKEITPLVERIVLSFATKSLGRRFRFSARRTWIISFIEENFTILDDFELGGERYISFKSRE
ncbi:hypothetical protein ISS08_01585 [Candidatus Pacearchaeota archaeon]|nr:hypothetical protein [Candidatus Pacearchaeota archaeon]